MADLYARVGGRGRSVIMGLAGPLIEGSSGSWVNVTPAGMLSGSEFGSISVVSEPLSPSILYAAVDDKGVYKSTNFGESFSGPIDAGFLRGGNNIIAAPGLSGVLYSGGIRDVSIGFWRSVNGGVDWTNFVIDPLPLNRQDVYAPSVDPYDPDHLIICGHEQDFLGESFDGGETWTEITLNAGMLTGAGTAFCFFIDTGNSSTTADTWLWSAQGTGGIIGTWRTTNGGSSWTKVDNNEHPHGNMQIWQPDTGGVVFMGGIYSALGQGVLRSTDYGATWAHVGDAGISQSGTITGTPNNVYSFYGFGASPTAYQTAPLPGITGWSSPGVPMTIGPAQMAVVTDGVRWAVIGACWTDGLWRYIE